MCWKITMNEYEKEIITDQGNVRIEVKPYCNKIYTNTNINTNCDDLILTSKQARQYAHKLIHAARVAEKNKLLNNAKHNA